uniref:Uncharacterized protein n=1 Tax=Sarcophilus harrisii TaxID=9305 RepID=A0A7N4PBA5_SARHA
KQGNNAAKFGKGTWLSVKP